MSRLPSRNNGGIDIDPLRDKLEPWMNNPPDYDEMVRLYKEKGRLGASIKRKQREITRAEELVTAEIDRPRSNDAKKAKLNATASLKDELAEMEAELEIIDAEVKAIEFMKTMFTSSNFRSKMMYEFA